MKEDLKPWDLSAEGIENVCKSLSNKLSAATIHFENGRKNTIINIDDYEHTILCWALSEYMSK